MASDGQKLKDWRKANRLKREEAAVAIGVSIATYSKMESDKYVADPGYWAKAFKLMSQPFKGCQIAG